MMANKGFKLSLLLILSILILLPMCAEKEKKYITISGSGATFPQPQLEKWITEFMKEYPNVKIEYYGGGSGKGLNDFKKGLVDFALSDPPVKESLWRELEKKGQVLQFPIIVGAIAIVYNIPGVDDLKLSKDVLVDIFLGKIEYWDDKRIKELNPDKNLPHEKIIVVHRSDSSGTTEVFTTYLSLISDEWKKKVGSGKVVDWPVDKLGRGLGGRGNQGVVAILKQTPYTIGYVELAYAIKENLQIAYIENAEGNFVKPNKDTIKEAMENVAAFVPDITRGYEEKVEMFLNAKGKNSYPIVAFSHMIVWKDYPDEKAEVIKNFIRWIMTKGQEDKYIVTGYVSLPTRIAELGLKAAEIIE